MKIFLFLSPRRLASLLIPALAGFLVVNLAGCGQATQAEGAQQVPAGCGMCIYKMDGVDECATAVKIDGSPYLLTGAKVDAHNIGLCSSEKTAEVTGQVEGDKFVATSFKLVK